MNENKPGNGYRGFSIAGVILAMVFGLGIMSFMIRGVYSTGVIFAFIPIIFISMIFFIVMASIIKQGAGTGVRAESYAEKKAEVNYTRKCMYCTQDLQEDYYYCPKCGRKV